MQCENSIQFLTVYTIRINTQPVIAGNTVLQTRKSELHMRMCCVILQKYIYNMLIVPEHTSQEAVISAVDLLFWN